MKVRLIKQHGLKSDGFYEKWRGAVFQVVEKRGDGYDVDLGPLGHPGEMGWMYNGEVIEVADSEAVVNRKELSCTHCNGQGVLNKGAGKPLFAAIAWLIDHEEACNNCNGSGKVLVIF